VDVAVDPHARLRRPRVGAPVSPVLGTGLRRPAARGAHTSTVRVASIESSVHVMNERTVTASHSEVVWLLA
jgi:hypothetical protein